MLLMEFSVAGIVRMFHGGRRWEGRPEIQPARRGRAECGPGIYLTTKYETARKYAKGGGVPMRVDVRVRMLLEDVAISLDQAKLMATDCVARARLKPLFAELDELSQRYMSHTFRSPFIAGPESPAMMPASSLLNLCINDDLLLGERGVRMAGHLTKLGIDASAHHANADDHWLVVFNPDAIVSIKKLPADKIELSDYSLPSPREQLESTSDRTLGR